MKRLILIVGFIAFLIGCSKGTEPGETQDFDLGYGESVGDCTQKAADQICRDLGWEKAVDYYCKTVWVNNDFWGVYQQDVMFSVTCWRPL